MNVISKRKAVKNRKLYILYRCTIQKLGILYKRNNNPPELLKLKRRLLDNIRLGDRHNI